MDVLICFFYGAEVDFNVDMKLYYSTATSLIMKNEYADFSPAFLVHADTHTHKLGKTTETW